MHGLSMAPWFHSVDVGSNAPLKGERGLAKLCSHAASATQAEQARFNGQPTQGSTCGCCQHVPLAMGVPCSH